MKMTNSITTQRRKAAEMLLFCGWDLRQSELILFLRFAFSTLEDLSIVSYA